MTNCEVSNGSTAYRNLYNKLAEDIASGVYLENARLPVERCLCDMYSVSRITVRQALSLLESDGLIMKYQGKGTFVRPRHFEQKLSSIYSFTNELIKMNSKPGVRVLSCKILPSELSVSEALKLEIEAPVIEVCRLRLADDEPFAYETSFIPAEYLKDASVGEIERDGLYATINKYSGLYPDHASEVFEATIASKEVAYNLRRDGKFAVMQVLRLASCNGKPVEYCRTFLAGDKYKYSVELGSGK